MQVRVVGEYQPRTGPLALLLVFLQRGEHDRRSRLSFHLARPAGRIHILVVDGRRRVKRPLQEEHLPTRLPSAYLAALLFSGQREQEDRMLFGELDHARIRSWRDRGREEGRCERWVGGVIGLPEGRDLRGGMRGRVDQGEVQDLRERLREHESVSMTWRATVHQLGLKHSP